MHVGQLKGWLEMRFSESWKRRTAYCISLVDYPLTVFLLRSQLMTTRDAYLRALVSAIPGDAGI